MLCSLELNLSFCSGGSGSNKSFGADSAGEPTWNSNGNDFDFSGALQIFADPIVSVKDDLGVSLPVEIV